MLQEKLHIIPWSRLKHSDVTGLDEIPPGPDYDLNCERSGLRPRKVSLKPWTS